ncbi:MAG: peptide deformylase [Patescibacteria group bacterium]|nr:peptide deformylase [Patescibacteria group bacterium]
MLTKIVQQKHPGLHREAKLVPLAEIESAKIKKIITDMKITLANQDDGVALAAPQIAAPWRIFIIAGKILSKDPESKKIPADLVFINPRLLKVSKKKEEMEEGCLSVRWLYGVTKRSTKATIEAYDQDGKKFIRHGSGLIAQIFQHEVDHLNGVLFTDHATDLREIKPEQ